MANVELNLSAETINDVVETLRADAGVQKRWKATADRLLSEGVDSDTLENDKDYKKVFKSEVILLSFTKTEQAIMAKPHTALSDEQKVTKRWVQMQIGTRLNKVLKYIKEAEAEAKLSDDEREAKAKTTFADRVVRDLLKVKEKIQKATAVTFSATKAIAGIDEVIAGVKGGFKE